MAPFVQECGAEFYRKITFKTTYICDLNSPLVEAGHLRFPCPKCGERAAGRPAGP